MTITWKHYGIVLLALVVYACLGAGDVMSMTKGIKGITNAAVQGKETIESLGYILSFVFIIGIALEVRSHMGPAVIITTIVVGLIICGLMLFAEDIINTLKPGAALASTGTLPLPMPSWQGWIDASGLCARVALLTEVVRRGRTYGAARLG